MLTDLEVRKAKPKAVDYKLSDSGGLYLFVSTAGVKSWRLKFRFGEGDEPSPPKGPTKRLS